MNRKVVAVLVAKTLEQLREGRIPWRRPWNVEAWPHNATTKKVYHGWNVFALNISAQAIGYEHNAWASFKQGQKAGTMVRKGEKSTPILFWNWRELEDTDKEGNTHKVAIPFIRYYNVFNVCQFETPEVFNLEATATDIPPVRSADDIVAGYHGPVVKHDSPGQAYYQPIFDQVHMSPRETHTSVDAYYSTLFHELVHSTGHSSRIDRLALSGFKSHAYSKEELVAEIGATMLCTLAGIETDIANHASYVAGWLSRLEDKPDMLITAATAAQKAVNWIKGEQVAEVAA